MSDPNSFSLFTYGSLMFSDVWQEVTGLSMQPVPARLHDHARYSVEDEDYPAVLRQPGQIVDGALYTGLSAAALAVLDRFEGPDYQRVTVQVLRTDGTQAEPIVFAPQSWPGAGQMVACAPARVGRWAGSAMQGWRGSGANTSAFSARPDAALKQA